MTLTDRHTPTPHEPRWVNISHMAQPNIEEEFDVAVHPDAPANRKYRHRQRSPDGETVFDWLPGQALK